MKQFKTAREASAYEQDNNIKFFKCEQVRDGTAKVWKCYSEAEWSFREAHKVPYYIKTSKKEVSNDILESVYQQMQNAILAQSGCEIKIESIKAKTVIRIRNKKENFSITASCSLV